MRLAHRVSLGGKQLDAIDPRIIIKGVESGAGKDTVTAVSTGAGDGMRITSKRRESMEVQVKFSMNIRRDTMEERAEVLEKIIAWANRSGYWLRVNYKPNRRLYVDEIQLPGEGDLWKRFSEYTITFRAKTVPYWQEEDAVTAVTKEGSSGSGTITVAGSAETLAEAKLTNTSGSTINTASITIGGKTMSFTSLKLGANKSLVIDHVITQGKNVIRIRAGSDSAMSKRSDDSADEFSVQPGNNAFSYTAQRACVLTVSVRGRFA